MNLSSAIIAFLLLTPPFQIFVGTYNFVYYITSWNLVVPDQTGKTDSVTNGFQTNIRKSASFKALA